MKQSGRKPTDSVRIDLRIPISYREALQQEADEEGITFSELLRRIFYGHLKKREGERDGEQR